MREEVRWPKDFLEICSIYIQGNKCWNETCLTPTLEVMKEVGIDISNQKSKDITEDMMRNSAYIVNMGGMEKESCPTFFLHNEPRLVWR